MKNRKRIWYIVISLIAIGLLLMIIGFTMGAKRGVYINGTGIHMIDNKTYKVEKFDLEQINTIEVDVKYIDVEVYQSDNYTLEIAKDTEESNIKWNLNNGKLEIVEASKFNLKLFNIDFGFIDGIKKRYIKIGIPENETLQNINLKTNSADVKIENIYVDTLNINNKYGKVQIDDTKLTKLEVNMNSGNLSLRNIETDTIGLKNKYGDIKLNNVNTKDSDFELNSGHIQLKDYKTDNLKIDAKYGNVKIEDIEVKYSNIKLNSGDLDIKGNITDNSSIYSKYGNVKIDTQQREEYYNCNLNSKYGNIKIDKEKTQDSQKYVTTNNEGKALNIETNSGNISVNFSK